MPITRFKRKQSGYIQGPTEPPRRRLAVGKYVYIVVLAVLVFLAGSWAVKRYMLIEGKGLFEPSMIEIKSKIPARIIENKARVDDQVKEDAPLVTLDRSDILNELAAKETELKKESVLARQRILATEKELENARAKRGAADGRLSDAGAELGRAKRLLASQAITRSQFMVLDTAFRENRREAELARHEVSACEGELKSQESEYSELSSKMEHERKQCRERLKETILCSPANGILTEVLKQPGELVRPGEVIMRVADTSEIIIKGYFDMNYEPMIKAGDNVEIIFEDNFKTGGKIRKVYPGALVMASDFKRPYGPVERAIVTEIVPAEQLPPSRILNTRSRIILNKFNLWPLR